MNLQAAKWGNSLALRIPAEYVRSIGVKEGDRVEATPERGRRARHPPGEVEPQGLHSPAPTGLENVSQKSHFQNTSYISWGR